MRDTTENASFLGLQGLSFDRQDAAIRDMVRANGALSQCTDSLRYMARAGLTIRSAQVKPQSLDMNSRSVDAVLATEKFVQIYDHRRYREIDEVLLMDGVTWTGGQVVLLECHLRESIQHVIGSVRSIRVEGSKLIGRLFFGDRAGEAAENAWCLVSQGHLTDVSVGYRIDKHVDIPPRGVWTVSGTKYKSGARWLRIVKRWTVRETSIVPIGADVDAQVRA